MTENPKRGQRSLNFFKFMAKGKKICPECGSELLEDNACPTCGSSPDEDIEKEGTKEDADLEDEPIE